MHELVKHYAFVFLALRALIDLTLAVIIYHQEGALVISLGLMLICSVFYFFCISESETSSSTAAMVVGSSCGASQLLMGSLLRSLSFSIYSSRCQW